MPNLTPVALYEDVPALVDGQPLQGGLDGYSNRPLKSLANRDEWLRSQILALQAESDSNLPAFDRLSARNYNAGGRTTVAANTALAEWVAEGELIVLLCPFSVPADARTICRDLVGSWALVTYGGDIRWTRSSPGTNEFFRGGSLPPNRFSWLRLKVKDGARPEVWINADKQTAAETMVLTGTPYSDGGGLSIGQKPDGTQSFPGIIARVIPLNCQLTDAEWFSFLAAGVLPKSSTGSMANAVNEVYGVPGPVAVTGTVSSFTADYTGPANGYVNLRNAVGIEGMPAGWYRMTFTATVNSGTMSAQLVTVATNVATVIDGAQTATFYHAGGILFFRFTGAAANVTFTGLTIRRLGPLWLGDLGEQPHMVIDRSNGNHGYDSGVVALWPSTKDAGKWIEKGLIANGQFQFAPGYTYRLTTATVQASAAVTGFKLGTTAAGVDVVAAINLTANTPTNLPLLKSVFTAPLYFAATTWGGASVSLNLTWERVRL